MRPGREFVRARRTYSRVAIEMARFLPKILLYMGDGISPAF